MVVDDSYEQQSLTKILKRNEAYTIDLQNSQSQVQSAKIPRSSTSKNCLTLEALSKIGYSYEGALSKLLEQTSIPPRFTLRDIISLADPALALTRKSVRTLTIREINRKIQNIEIKECEIKTLGFEQDNNVVSKRQIPDSKTSKEPLQTVEVCPIFVKSYSRYSDYYSLTPKVVITLTRRAKLIDVRAILDTRVEVSIIILDTTTRFEILITYSLEIV